MLEAYDGGFDQMENVAALLTQMALYGMSDAIMCQAFFMTLRWIARGWYGQLLLTSIHSFDQLSREFEANFLTSAQPKPTTVSLLEMRQKEDEPLSLYLFTKEIRAIPDVHPSLVIHAFMIRIRPSRLFWSLVERPPMTMLEILQRANQYVVVEALKGLLKTPNLIRTRVEECDHERYCRFHRDYEHNIEECYDLKNQIEDLIRRGHLDRFVRKSRKPSLHPKGPIDRQVDVIVGGPTMGGNSSSAHLAILPRMSSVSSGDQLKLYHATSKRALSAIPTIRRPVVATIEEATVAHPDWREELRYKRDATLPTDKEAARQVKRIEVWYDILNGCL
ncbi:hypothetical protein B296_00049923 [Ensete ventricosum]|uniref:Retrotransposon gag domain-containing protein n=1 Tax=Ensete ventricosum TaxID=4639 RepID=A0A426Y905_ENSVE|nr:hypothetical protein B296_00049923 [Ensete ventricosum]